MNVQIKRILGALSIEEQTTYSDFCFVESVLRDDRFNIELRHF